MHDRIHVRELIPELNIKAKEELNEDISRISADIHLIKEWLEKQPHLRARREDQWILSFLRGCKFSLERTKQKFDFYYKARTLTPEMCSVNLKEEKFWSIFEGGFVLPLETLDLNGNRLAITSPGGFDPEKYTFADAVQVADQLLVSFLRGCKFSLERAKDKIDMFYTLRTLVPEFYCNRDPMQPVIQELLSLGIYLPLRRVQGPDAAKVCIMRLGVFDPSNYHLTDCIKVSFMISQILMAEDDNLMISGQEMIIDLKNVSMNVIGQFTPAFAKKIATCMEKGLQVRQKAYHMINTPPGFDTVYALFRSFLSDKLKKRIRVHNVNYEAMHNDISKKILPIEYGGEDGSIKELTEFWKTKVESYRSWFLEQESQKSDEKKRPGKQKTSQELFGLEGSFRQIEFD